MNTPIYSVAHPTLGRPKIAIERCNEWFSKCENPGTVEYVFGVHSFDAPENIKALQEFSLNCGFNVKISITGMRGSAPNWNQSAIATSGALIIQAQDDLAPPLKWDRYLGERLNQLAGEKWAEKLIFIAVSDGHRADRLCITTILTRPYLESRKFFLFPGYEGVYADDDSTAQAYKDAKEGKIILIEAREIVFDHQHYTTTGGLEFDQTYAIENAPAAYRKGALLFAKRHPEWHAKQMCKKPPLMRSGIVTDFSTL